MYYGSKSQTLSKPLKRHIMKEKPYEGYTMFFDTETYSINEYGEQEMLLACYEIWKTSRATGLPDNRRDRHKPFERGIITSIDEFYEILKNFDEDIRVIAHNMGYDAQVVKVLSWKLQNRHGYDINPTDSIIATGARRMGPFSLKLHWDSGKTTHLICNNNFYKNSLKELGESFGLEKKDFPEKLEELVEVKIDQHNRDSFRATDSDETERLATTGNELEDRYIKVVAYCKRDVEILSCLLYTSPSPRDS